MGRIWFGLGVAAAFFLVAGCIDFEYVGREFEPTPISEPVAYYVNREQLPPGEFRIMGRMQLSAPDGTDGYDIQELLLEKARAFGADAVCLVLARKVPVGHYPHEEVSQAPQLPLDPENVDFRGAREPLAEEQEEFGQPQTLSSAVGVRYEVEVKALFLKRKAELERLTSGRDQELEEILGAPSEPSRRVVETEPPLPDAAEAEPEAAPEIGDESDAPAKEAEAPESGVESSAPGGETEALETAPDAESFAETLDPEDESDASAEEAEAPYPEDESDASAEEAEIPYPEDESGASAEEAEIPETEGESSESSAAAPGTAPEAD